MANLAFTVISPPRDGSDAKIVGTWLKQSGHPGDTAVVAYGQPNVLGNAEMASPYPYLWSLPVRTLDPDLSTMEGVLTGPDRPTWFVDWSGIDSWGISDPARTHEALDQHYREVAEICGRTIWLVRDETRTLADVKDCP
ncbi:hypothetical protein [Aeromicrobium sp. UC242_57]|uniref:hypothetical protein n=1 Tax=Aeromicrobium sp. UC242_57 TaxID=3374624 RepID=UPI0037BB77F8